MVLNYKIQRLTAEEIQELKFDQVLRIIQENCNMLADIENELFDSIGEAGKWNIKVQQLKSLKGTVTEMNRGLKAVIQNG